jgi:predicted SnoaL-like aldol condensation-catalyzing enzyme
MDGIYEGTKPSGGRQGGSDSGRSFSMKKCLSLIAGLLALSSAAHAGLPVTPAPDQQLLLQSKDPKLAANKKLIYDFTRIILRGRRLEQVAQFMREDYIQHNPNVETGMKGFVDFFSKLGGPKPIPDQVPDLVSIQAEGDLVTFSFVNEQADPKNPNAKYSTTWFDMFRVQDGKIAEHWDCDTK